MIHHTSATHPALYRCGGDIPPRRCLADCLPWLHAGHAGLRIPPWDAQDRTWVEDWLLWLSEGLFCKTLTSLSG